MAKLIRRSERLEDISYELVYEYEDTPGAGFSFPCDAQGKVGKLPHLSQANYQKCVTNTLGRPVTCRGVVKTTSEYRLPALLRCDCGQELELSDPMTNQCPCGEFYNGSGQHLSHPRNWGEETGELFSDSGALIL